MSGQRCLFCGGSAERDHHCTGRDALGRYIDPGFVAPTCHDDHELTHDDWYTHGAGDGLVETATFLHALQLGLERVGMFVGRLAEATPPPLDGFLAGLAAWLAKMAGGLAGSIASLDRYCPGWQTKLGE
jgi:hypothetical protein